MVSDDGLVTQAVRVCAVSDERMRRLLKGSGLEEAPFFPAMRYTAFCTTGFICIIRQPGGTAWRMSFPPTTFR